MKKLLVGVILALSFINSRAQTTVPLGPKNSILVSSGTLRTDGVFQADGTLLSPVRDTNFIPTRVGAIVNRPADSSLYRFNGRTSTTQKKWDKITTGGLTLESDPNFAAASPQIPRLDITNTFISGMNIATAGGGGGLQITNSAGTNTITGRGGQPVSIISSTSVGLPAATFLNTGTELTGTFKLSGSGFTGSSTRLLTVAADGSVSSTPQLTNVSQLSNDAGYRSLSQVATQINDSLKIKDTLFHKSLGGGVSIINSIIKDTINYKTFLNGTGYTWVDNGTTIALTLTGSTGGGDIYSTRTTSQSITRSTGDGSVLTLVGASTNSVVIGTNTTFGQAQISSPARLDINAAQTLYLVSGNYVNLQAASATVVNRLPGADASSIGTQKNSSDLVFESSLYPSGAGAFNYAGFKYVASTTVAGQADFGIYVNGSGNSDLFSATGMLTFRNTDKSIRFPTFAAGSVDSTLATKSADGRLIKYGEAHSRTSVPTASVSSNAGTGATVTVDGGSNDIRGRITLTTGTGTVSSGTIVTIIFGTSYASAAYGVVVPATANATTLGTYTISGTVPGQIQFYLANTPANSTVYQFHYVISQ